MFVACWPASSASARGGANPLSNACAATFGSLQRAALVGFPPALSDAAPPSLLPFITLSSVARMLVDRINRDSMRNRAQRSTKNQAILAEFR
jgi:hypothetical protein